MREKDPDRVTSSSLLFYRQWYPAYQEHHFSCQTGNMLVRPSLQIGKFSANLRFRMNAHADLVANDKEGCLNFLQRSCFFPDRLQGLIDIVLIKRKKIGQPKCNAIDHDHFTMQGQPA